MANNFQYVGIDISKTSFNAALIKPNRHIKLENNEDGFLALIEWFKENKLKKSNTWVVMEYTGGYEEKLLHFLHKKGAFFTRVTGYEIKLSSGVARIKNDKSDAFTIANYANNFKSKLVKHTVVNEKIALLRIYLSQRRYFLKISSGLKNNQKELAYKSAISSDKLLNDIITPAKDLLTKSVSQIEKNIKNIINSDAELKRNYDLIFSIPAVGELTAWFMIAFTENFTKFKNGRKFGSYCGVVPFKQESGTSLSSVSKISYISNRELKTQLHLAAISSLKFDIALKEYYDRKKSEGKHAFTILNAIRFKIILRIFAVIKAQKPFERHGDYPFELLAKPTVNLENILSKQDIDSICSLSIANPKLGRRKLHALLIKNEKKVTEYAVGWVLKKYELNSMNKRLAKANLNSTKLEK